MGAVTESDLEHATLEWFAELGYEVLPSDHLDPESVYGERSSLSDAVLVGRLDAASRRLNPDLAEDTVEQALKRVLRRDQATLALDNEVLHRLMTEGIELEVAGDQGRVAGERVQLIDFDDPDANDWMVTNQVTVIDRARGSGRARRLDVVVYVNGLPLAVFELKNPGDAQADIGKAIQQLRNYREDVPSLLVPNVMLVASDDVEARLGSITADASRYALWRTVEGEHDAPRHAQPLEVLVRGVFEKARLLDFVRNFVTFEHDDSNVHKKIAAYHQFHAVRRAVDETARAAGKGGDRRVGVVWHTQGSGKSLTMLFYAGKLVLDPRMENPTLVVLTDRNDLDEQLFGTFAKSQRLLRQTPVQAESRAHLRELLRTASGGIYFTTIQKFAPEDAEKAEPLSKRRNIVVIADEAHRSQYGFEAKFNRKTGQKSYGLAKHLRDALPGASFIGFTGTPVELDDKSTVEVFGNHISVYDILQAVEDKATVPIYYENRLARLGLSDEERPHIDSEFDELTEGEEEEQREALKSEWSTLETLVGSEKRLKLIAKDIVDHYEKRSQGLAGKALVVCMSRRIAAELYRQIVALRPQWHDPSDEAGTLKVVITGSSSDSELLRPHVRTKSARERLADRFKDPEDPLKLVIVRDMWLTGFDAPCLHTLYVDKPMQGHNLMQAIARVNRVFGDKPGGLVVDYIGIATFLKRALLTYQSCKGRGEPTRDKHGLVHVMLEQLAICRDVFHGFDVAGFLTATPARRLALLPAAREHVLAQRGAEPDGYETFLQAVSKLTSAFAAATPDERCEEIRDEVAFYQAVRAGLLKLDGAKRTLGGDLSHAVRQIVSNALVSTEVVDVFAAAGLERPDLSVLSPEFLVEVQGMKHKNLAAALLARLLRDEVRKREQRNVVQGRRFSEMLEDALSRYRARSITNVEVIEALMAMAKELREADARGAALKLTVEESAFFDALAENQSAVEAMKDEGLATIARQLGDVVRTKATLDWNQKRTVQARLRVELKKVLRKAGYPPDQCDKAVALVIEQAERLKINLVDGGSEADTGRVDDEDGDDASLEPAPEVGELPYPIAVFDGLIASHANAVLRVKSLRDAFDKGMTFLAAIALAALRDRGNGALGEPAKKVLAKFAGKPISMGGWFELAAQLAELVPSNPADPVACAVRVLIDEKGKRSALALAIGDVIHERNDFSHTVTASEESAAAAEPELRALWARFEKALAPLRKVELVSRAGLTDHDPKTHTARYQVHALHGSPAHFPIRERTVRGRLETGWAYLLNGETPLSLAPLVHASASEADKRDDLFLARTIELTPGKSVELVSVAGAGKKKVKAP
jgi:type I restriction enzyme R subunit